jgi:integrase
LQDRRLVKTSTPGIFKRGNRYVAVYRDPSGKQRKQSARTLAEARAFKATVAADVRRGEYRELSRVSFADYAKEWCATYRGRTRRGVGAGTLADYADAINRFAIPKLGKRRLAEITPQDLRTYVSELEAAGLAPASVRKFFAPVRALFATALEDGLIRSSPTAGIRIANRRENVEIDDERVKALTGEQLQRLLAEVRCERHAREPFDNECATCDVWRLFIRFLAETGLRIGEAVEVRYADIDEQGWLHVRRNFTRGKVGRPKGGKSRRIRFTASLASELRQRRQETWAGLDDLVFAGPRGARVDGRNFARRIVKPAGRRAGVGDWVSPHTFRHTAATLLFRAGWNAVQVQRFLGHADPGFTLGTYVHLLPEDLPSTDFLTEITTGKGNTGATQPTEIGRDDHSPLALVSGL